MERGDKILVQYSNIQFYENLCVGNSAIPCGQMDRHEKTSVRLLRHLTRGMYVDMLLGHFQDRPLCGLNLEDPGLCYLRQEINTSKVTETAQFFS